MRIALGIPHLPDDGGPRDQALKRLMVALDIHASWGVYQDHDLVVEWRLFADKCPNWEWSGEMWAWGAETGADYFLTLQDDALVCAGFFQTLKEMLEDAEDIRLGDVGGTPYVAGSPIRVIGLQAPHPARLALRDEGHSWHSTTEGVIGVAYVLAREALEQFVSWRSRLPHDTVAAITEDSLLGLWCAVVGERVYHPIPTIVDHDTSIVSTYGNDAHERRHGQCVDLLGTCNRWSVTIDDCIPHLGRFYDSTAEMLRIHELASEETISAVAADNGFNELRRLHHFVKSRRHGITPPKVFIATPNQGLVHSEYCASIWLLQRDEQLDCSLSFEMIGPHQMSQDIVKCRNRLAFMFLDRTDCEWLFFVDSDISFAPVTLRGMLLAGKTFVTAPYPRRNGVDLQAVRETKAHLPPETLAFQYPVRLQEGAQLDPDNACVDIDGIGLGCALIHRDAIAAIASSVPRYWEILPGTRERAMVPQMFNLIETEEDGLLSEDYSFCRRAIAAGHRPTMYLGHGSPVTHHGEYAYRGVVESFGVRRGQ